jgi:hypothetical protein
VLHNFNYVPHNFNYVLHNFNYGVLTQGKRLEYVKTTYLKLCVHNYNYVAQNFNYVVLTQICHHTIDFLQSLCVSHKAAETYRNQHAPRFLEGKTSSLLAPWAAIPRWKHPLKTRPEHRPSSLSIRHNGCVL